MDQTRTVREAPFFRHAHIAPRVDRDRYPATVPAFAQIDRIRFHPAVTILAGENGSGKSTIIEALAIAAGFPAHGGTKGFRFAADSKEADLDTLVLQRNPRREDGGFFLRAESAHAMVTYAHEVSQNCGDFWSRNLQDRSHGEAFMDIFTHRFSDNESYLFILDEIESALSPAKQLEFLARMHRLVGWGSQFIVSTHSPILMSYPNARLYWLDVSGIEERDWRETDHARLLGSFLKHPEEIQRRLGIAPEPPRSLFED